MRNITDVLALAKSLINDSKGGCIGVFTETTSATLRFGECSDRCQQFVGCPRKEKAEQCEDCDECAPPTESHLYS